MSHEPLEAVLARGDAALEELDGVRYLTYPALDKLPGVHALTTLRESGDGFLGKILTEWDEPVANLSRAARVHGKVGDWIARALDVTTAGFAAGRQTHEDRCEIITADNAPPPGELYRFGGTDALLTQQHGVALVVLTADCLPIFLADATAGAVGILHAGKIGTRKRIASQVAEAFFANLRAQPATTVAVIGPSIGDGCYPQSLWEENVRQLRDAGVATIVQPSLCTRCNLEHFYSYRAEKGFTGRMVSAIIRTKS